ncbi:MAG: SWIM zinc finger family protein [Oscillospiraceae bacterium]|nr:SWIM zinc finger family protein [Oscillospiraceae bacterium]
MNIKDFEKHIDPTILSRGLDYYKNKYITALEYDEDDGEWVAEVSGSDDYTVTVKLSETGDIFDSYCDCPYDYGGYCKHQAAVFYLIRKHLEGTAKKPPGQKPPKVKFEDMLNKIEKDELISFLTEYAAENKKFKSEFMLKFADRFLDKSNIMSYAKNLIKSSFTGLVHNGYIEYHDAPKVVRGAEKVLEIAKNENDQYKAVGLCIIVIEEMLRAESEYNTERYCYGTAEQALDLLERIVDSFTKDTDELKRIFAFLTAFISDNKTHGFSEFNIDILNMFVPLCGIKYIREGVEKYIKIIENQTTQDHRKNEMQELRYAIISKFDGKKAALEFIYSHLENDKFREMAIEHALSAKDYDKALDLCFDAEKKNPNYRGRSKWKYTRYNIYEKNGDRNGQKELAYEFAVGGEFEYYLKLRKLYADNSKDTGEWHRIFDEILASVSESYPKRIYTDILIHEKMKPELLEYCAKHISTITEFHSHLLPDYKNEVNEIFTAYLKKSASQASDRRQYSEVCALIKKYAKICGKKNASEIIQEFKSLYAKRPAFVDELRKMEMDLCQKNGQEKVHSTFLTD